MASKDMRLTMAWLSRSSRHQMTSPTSDDVFVTSTNLSPAPSSCNISASNWRNRIWNVLTLSISRKMSSLPVWSFFFSLPFPRLRMYCCATRSRYSEHEPPRKYRHLTVYLLTCSTQKAIPVRTLNRGEYTRSTVEVGNSLVGHGGMFTRLWLWGWTRRRSDHVLSNK